MAELTAEGEGLTLDRLMLAIAGPVMLAVCIAASLPCGVLAAHDTTGSTWIGNNGPVFFARQDAAIDATDAANENSGPEARSGSEAESKTTPAESDTLKEFTPSEEIEADQGVDFPYDI